MKTYFEIQAEDCARAANFYKQVFGWEIKKHEGMPIEYWRINLSDGAILKSPAPKPSHGFGTNAYVCSFEVANFDEAAKKITSASGQVALPKFAVPGICYQGYFIDTEGNTFGIFEPNANAK